MNKNRRLQALEVTLYWKRKLQLIRAECYSCLEVVMNGIRKIQDLKQYFIPYTAENNKKVCTTERMVAEKLLELEDKIKWDSERLRCI